MEKMLGSDEVVIVLETLEAPQHLVEASLEKRRSVLWVKKQISKAFAFNSCGAEKKLTNNLLKENGLK